MAFELYFSISRKAIELAVITAGTLLIVGTTAYIVNDLMMEEEVEDPKINPIVE